MVAPTAAWASGRPHPAQNAASSAAARPQPPQEPEVEVMTWTRRDRQPSCADCHASAVPNQSQFGPKCSPERRRLPRTPAGTTCSAGPPPRCRLRRLPARPCPHRVGRFRHASPWAGPPTPTRGRAPCRAPRPLGVRAPLHPRAVLSRRSAASGARARDRRPTRRGSRASARRAWCTSRIRRS